MKEYETVFIVHPSLSDAELKRLNERCEQLILRHDGVVFFNKNIGKRNLAYPIKKQTKGNYFCLDYTARGDVVYDLERQLRLDENVLRFLTTVRNKNVDVELRKLEIATQKDEIEKASLQPSVLGKQGLEGVEVNSGGGE